MSRKTKLLAVALTAIMVLSVFAYAPAATEASSQANTLVVDDNNDYNDDNDNDNQYHTIQGAVNDAEPGDTIEVRAGVYNENVMVDVGDLTIVGDGASQVTVVGNASNATVTLGADNLVFKGFNVTAPPDGEEALLIYDLIEDSHVKNVLVEENVIHGHDDTNILAMATPPGGNDQARDLIIRDNEFTGATVGSMDIGLHLNAKNSLLEDNTFTTKVHTASLKVSGPGNTVNNTTIEYPGYAWSGMWISSGGTNTMVNTLTVDGHPDEHLHEDEKRGDWLKYGVYVDGSGSTLTDVDSHESHVGIYIGGYRSVSDVSLLDSVADDNLNHDLEIQGNSQNIHVENFDAMSTTVPEGSQADEYKSVYPTYGVNVLVWGGSGHSLVDVTSTNEFPVGIAMLNTDDSLVDDSELRNKGPGSADLTKEEDNQNGLGDIFGTTGIMLVDSDDNTISNSLVSENDVGISITDGEGNAIVDNNPTGQATDEGIYNNTDAGIQLQNADYTHIDNNDVRRNGIGLDSDDSNPVRAKFNNFVGNDAGIDEDGGAVNATLNWFGSDDGPSGPATDGVLSGSGDSIAGNVEYDPFLTAPKDDVIQDEAKLQQYAHDFVSEGSQGVQTIGSPGPADVSFQFSNGSNAIVWTYDGSFNQVTSANTQASTLEGYIITSLDAGEDARVVIDFSDGTVGTPGSASLDSGWNFVAAPQYGETERVMQSTTEILRVHSGYDQFDSQPYSPTGPSTFSHPFVEGDSDPGPDVSAFSGYWVYVDGDGQMTATIPVGVTLTEEPGLIQDN